MADEISIKAKIRIDEKASKSLLKSQLDNIIRDFNPEIKVKVKLDGIGSLKQQLLDMQEVASNIELNVSGASSGDSSLENQISKIKEAFSFIEDAKNVGKKYAPLLKVA